MFVGKLYILKTKHVQTERSASIKLVEGVGRGNSVGQSLHLRMPWSLAITCMAHNEFIFIQMRLYLLFNYKSRIMQLKIITVTRNSYILQKFWLKVSE